MEKAKELLVTEISEVIACPNGEVEERIFAMLSQCFKDVTPRIES
jgi:hypothetical protein